MTQEINKAFHEMAGKCWHEYAEYNRFMCRCGYVHIDNPESLNPDYCADPRLVLKAMMETSGGAFFYDMLVSHHNYTKVEIYNLFMDTTGKLALLAIEWLRREK